ncbi:DUF4864 domain-containing protein (plasmid) [Halorubrum salinarum]|uniref:DUF4864 domain-containing protein n=1 Tax=Halorubrum salinarum TaxID=2739057 RepID=A0A7D4CPB5_9EURY|nr:DUF4864 domain-containing protein [Halorubrum salinarum]QKG94201.1 DUF4864 domain-containing protein [Halorubrum salinarum]
MFSPSSSDEYPVEGVPTPTQEFGPGRAVEIQLTALADNDDPVENAGIKAAYNFASPANRRATGPLSRFVRMVEQPRYAVMIDHVEAVTGALERDGDRAEQRVRLTGPGGRTATYLFGLSEGATGPLAGCWLTDRVLVE